MICLAAVVIWFFPQHSRVETRELVIEPSQLQTLSNVVWQRQAPVGADEHATVWLGLDRSDGRELGAYVLKTYKQRNALVARSEYRATPRKVFEKHVPGSTVDADDALDLLADEFDVFCFDFRHVYREDHGRCETWLYWARYGQYIFYLDLNNREFGLDDIAFRGLVTEIDGRLSRRFDR